MATKKTKPPFTAIVHGLILIVPAAGFDSHQTRRIEDLRAKTGTEIVRHLGYWSGQFGTDCIDHLPPDQLLQVWLCFQVCGRDVYPDQATAKQIKLTLSGHVPDFRETKAGELIPVYRRREK